MNPIKYESVGMDPIYVCGECKLIYSRGYIVGETSFDAADRCCRPVSCGRCHGPVTRKNWTMCDDCVKAKERERLERIFEQAEKVEGWDGPVYDEFGSRYFYSIDELLDHYEDESLPKWVFCCDIQRPHFDLDGFLEQAEENMELEDGIEVDWQGLDELRRAVAEFNDKQTQSLWYPDNKRVVDLRARR